MKKIVAIMLIVALIVSCSGNTEKASDSTSPKSEEISKPVSTDPMDDKGIGPVSSVTIPAEIDAAMAAEGEQLFTTNCSACHKLEKRFVGPALNGVTKKQSPEWIMNMIMNPEVMVEKNETAKKLLEEYLSPMANQNISEEDARKIYEYFRQNDNK